MKIYVPSEYVNSSCFTINNGYIRAYTNDSLTEYVDIYVNQDYMLKKGNTTYTQNITCDSLNTLTDDWLYRLDLDKILICLLILIILVIGIPLKVVSRFFRRFQ